MTLQKSTDATTGRQFVADELDPNTPLTDGTGDAGDLLMQALVDNIEDHGKLITVEENADVTDEANVTAALPVVDETSLIYKTGDATANVKIDVDAISTATTRTITMPDADVNLGNIAANAANIAELYTPMIWTGGVADWDDGTETGTDNRASFITAFEAARDAGRPLYVKTGAYRFSNFMIFNPTQDMILLCDPETRFVFDQVGTQMSFQGTVATQTTLSANVNRGEYTIDTVDDHGASIGDMVAILGNENPEDGWGGPAYYTKHVSIVTAVPTTKQLTIAHPLNFNFFIGDDVEIETSRGQVYVENLYFDTSFSEQTAHNCVTIKHVNGIRFKRCRFKSANPGGQCDAIGISSSQNMLLEWCRADNFRYGCLNNFTRNVAAVHNEANDLRHFVSPSAWADGTYVEHLWGERGEGLIDSHPSFNFIAKNVENLDAYTITTMNARALGIHLENIRYKSTYATPSIQIGLISMDNGPYPNLGAEYTTQIISSDIDCNGAAGNLTVSNCGYLKIDGLNMNGGTLKIGSATATETVRDWELHGLMNIGTADVEVPNKPRIYQSQFTKTTQPRYVQDATLIEHTGTANATGSDSTHINLDDNFGTADDDLNGYGVEITGGTGSGQYRRISDWVSSTNIATVATAWTTTPDGTSQYRVHRYELDVGYAPDFSVGYRKYKAEGQILGGGDDDGITAQPSRVRIYAKGRQPQSISADRFQQARLRLYHTKQFTATNWSDTYTYEWSHKFVVSTGIRGPTLISRTGDAVASDNWELRMEDVQIDTGTTSWIEFDLIPGSAFTTHSIAYELNTQAVSTDA